MTVEAQWTQTAVIDGEVQMVAYTNSALFASTTLYGLYRSTNNGTDWTSIKISTSIGSVESIVSSGEKIFAATMGSGVFLSTNNGTTWTPINTGLSSKYVYDLSISGTTLFASVGSIFRASVTDTVWSAIPIGLTNKFVQQLTVSGTNLFASTSDSVFRSTDSGDHWTSASTGLNFTQGDALFASGSTLFRGGFNGIYRSTNYGVQWDNLNTGLMTHWAKSITIYGSNVFVGLYGGGLARSPDNGAKWYHDNTGWNGFESVTSLDVSGTHLFAVADRQVWRRSLSQITFTSDQSVVVPKQMELRQNFPNPFNPSTTIQYALPLATHVKLTIHDILGREVATLVNEEQSAGWKDVHFNASNLSSGVYFYKLQAGTFIGVKKLLLTK